MNKLIIKGTLTSKDHPVFFGIWFFRLIGLSLLCIFALTLFLFRELPEYLESHTIDEWALPSLLIILGWAGFAYFMTTTHYYLKL